MYTKVSLAYVNDYTDTYATVIEDVKTPWVTEKMYIPTFNPNGIKIL